MRIYLTDQKSKFLKHIEILKSKSVMHYDKHGLIEKITTIDINTNTGFEELDLQFLFDYKIFPSNILTFLAEWEYEKRKMKVGDTIVQQAYLPPVISLSQKVIFGVRVSEIIDDKDRKGFSYETLEGHVEKGISTFTVERIGNRKIFKIHTFSTPGNVLTKILGPIMSVPYQTYCTRKALENVKNQIEKTKNAT